jgi:hypothetical protein
MSSSITFDVIYDPTKETPVIGYHTITIISDKKFYLIKVPSELAHVLPPWSVLRFKSSSDPNPSQGQMSEGLSNS